MKAAVTCTRVPSSGLAMPRTACGGDDGGGGGGGSGGGSGGAGEDRSGGGAGDGVNVRLVEVECAGVSGSSVPCCDEASSQHGETSTFLVRALPEKHSRTAAAQAGRHA